jgi:hypothetical protein
LLRKVAVSSGTVFEEAGILKRRMLGLATVSLVVGIAVASAVSALAAGDHDLEDGWLRPAVAGGLTRGQALGMLNDQRFAAAWARRTRGTGSWRP